MSEADTPFISFSADLIRPVPFLARILGRKAPHIEPPFRELCEHLAARLEPLRVSEQPLRDDPDYNLEIEGPDGWVRFYVVFSLQPGVGEPRGWSECWMGVIASGGPDGGAMSDRALWSVIERLAPAMRTAPQIARVVVWPTCEAWRSARAPR